MDFFHGIRTRQARSSISTPTVATSGITFAVGTAPVHTVGGANVNIPVMGTNNSTAVRALGYGDDWSKYTLCEVMFNHFRLYATAPVFFVNVLDPAIHKRAQAAQVYSVVDGRVLLPFEAIAKSVTVDTSVRGEDFELFYDENALFLEIIDGGAIQPSVTELTISFDIVDPEMVTKADIIGGFNVATKQTTGLELIEQVFPRFGICPDLIICPGFSHDAEVAAVMDVKATSINGIFEAKALIDVDTKAVRHYEDAPAWKQANGINGKHQILCFPKFKLGERVFHASTHAAGVIARTDTENNGAPSESPSNKSLRINSTVIDDGTEVLLDLQQANHLNANGIATALNFTGGFVFWGNETACFPENQDVKDYFISVSRMFGWVSGTTILTNWSKVDRKMSRRLIDSVVNTINVWLNALRNDEHLLGGRIEFREDENTDASIASGKAKFRIFMTPPSPAREIEFVLEYDFSYLIAALTA